MSVYNGEPFLVEAIESILNQTFDNFEFIIINDSSSDSSLDILTSYTDRRIKLINNDTNIGLTKSLNKGLKVASGKYIARMDADDIAYKYRLEKQYNFLEHNNEIGVLGTQAISNGKFLNYKIKHPTSDYHIKWKLFFSNPIVHPSVMYHKTLIESIGGYNENKLYGQDYDLWVRLIPITKFANLDKACIFLRRHRENISIKKESKQRVYAIQTINALYSEILERKFTVRELESFFYHKFETKLDRDNTNSIIDELFDFFLRNNKLTDNEKNIIINEKQKLQLEINYPLRSKIMNLIGLQ